MTTTTTESEDQQDTKLYTFFVLLVPVMLGSLAAVPLAVELGIIQKSAPLAAIICIGCSILTCIFLGVYTTCGVLGKIRQALFKTILFLSAGTFQPVVDALSSSPLPRLVAGALTLPALLVCLGVSFATFIATGAIFGSLVCFLLLLAATTFSALIGITASWVLLGLAASVLVTLLGTKLLED